MVVTEKKSTLPTLTGMLCILCLFLHIADQLQLSAAGSQHASKHHICCPPWKELNHHMPPGYVSLVLLLFWSPI